MERLSQVQTHLTSASRGGVQAAKQKNPDDVVIVAAYRTAITKGGKGLFKDLKSDEILYKFTKKFLEKVNVDPAKIGDVACGNVLNKGAGATEHRAAVLAAGIPDSVPFIAINRQCSSSLTAVNDIANKILAGQIDIGYACGVESMTSHYGPGALAEISPNLKKDVNAKKCEIPMGITNENIADKYHIDRKVQDEFAAASYNKAERSIELGLFKDEILPVEVEVTEEEENDDDEEDSKVVKKTVIVDTDSGPRKGVSPQSLAKIRPAFKKTGSTHAGNSSQVSDGASGALLARRDVAEKLGLPIVGKYVAYRVLGVPPEIMGVGPGYAIPQVLEATGLKVDDVSVYEINEAFAAQALFSIHKVGIDINKVNPRGGAIALGHPLAATGTRQLATLLRELKTGEIGVTSMCLGTGMGAAAVFVKE
ncbi:POT2 [Cyberlindnera jadinii]|uniref:acetyl-CoA C-acyltransferase n=1 Tax=Cyberlindnera jadinii (strain ATCC 18201 / CBS 1600 / BCRC 20928 / JCM 3617 / NBRC 0987 / NRRL Y-1542) TaxID=983966 RepID=A0A0H5BZF7_CYBJN|nr:thiolase [Cyberlindnera jadinii NRRL Y-1542]ODV76211.1 thiolase [Cyberlindnera jadinii NRRL Y-1542]CEP20873.1 POT2 [Cyberlindnera jadinii]